MSMAVAKEKEFRALGNRVRNWGRWGDADELGTVNLITDERRRDAAQLVRTGRLFSLGATFDLNGPQGEIAPNRWNPMHFVTVAGDYSQSGALRHWPDPVAAMVDGMYEQSIMRFNDDVVIMPLQAATQWDALSHVYYEERLYNGYPAESVTTYGATRLGIEKIGARGVSARGVLLDVARHRGVEWIDAAAPPVEPDELDDVIRSHGIEIRPGDVLVVRTGWLEQFERTRNRSLPSNGLSWRCAGWFHDHDIAAVAADNVTVEALDLQVEGVYLAMHCLCLRDMGMMFGELWSVADLAADCAADGVCEFLLTAPPIRVTGGIGSPLNPIALK
jgi:kynurenine formamidase